MWICSIISMIIAVTTVTSIELRKMSTRVDELNSEVSRLNYEYQYDAEILNREVEDLKVFTAKPIDKYTVDELFTIDMVKEFDATYRQELDDDPNLGNYLLLDAKDVSNTLLSHRADDARNPVIIERIFGVVTDENRNGKTIDAGTDNCYISYQNIKDARVGDLVVSYIMYANNNFTGDIVAREDFVIKVGE